MDEAQAFEILPQVAHVFQSRQVLAYQKEIQDLRTKAELNELTAACVNNKSLKYALKSFNFYSLKCDCVVCATLDRDDREILRALFMDKSNTSCKLLPVFTRLAAKHKIVVEKYRLPYVRSCQCQPTQVPPLWARPFESRAYCSCAPQAHIYIEERGLAWVKFGRLVWEAKTVDDLKSVRDLLDDLMMPEHDARYNMIRVFDIKK
jgi:hypothetical protein